MDDADVVSLDIEPKSRLVQALFSLLPFIIRRIERVPPQLIPLPQNTQGILLLDLRHFIPIRDPAERSIAIHHQRAQVVELDGAAGAGDVEFLRVLFGRWEGERGGVCVGGGVFGGRGGFLLGLGV